MRVYFSGHPDTYDRLRDEQDELRYDGEDERERLFRERWGGDEYDPERTDRIARGLG